MVREKYRQRLEDDIAAGNELQVLGTPTFFVGYSDPDDPSRIRVVRSIVGDAPYSEFQKAIAEALDGLK